MARGRPLVLAVALLALCPGFASAQPATSARVEAFFYLIEGDAFVLPIVRADRGALHLEGRYQYEDRETASVWAGWSLTTGKELELSVVPMMGIVFGRTQGWAPGLEAALAWKSLELYTEAEYVLDVEGEEGDFFYSWSQLGWDAAPWLTLGLSAQRTRLYDSEFSIEHGVFAAARHGSAELSLFGFNLDGEDPFAIMALGVEF